MSLPDDAVAFPDAHVEEKGLGSRSTALQKALRLLRASGLGAPYEAAWSEWGEENDHLWDSSTWCQRSQTAL